MAHVLFGCTSADLALTQGGITAPGAGPFSVFTTGPDRATSVAVTDLKDRDGNAITAVRFEADGFVRFQAPDQFSSLWIDTGVGLRVAVRPVDLAGKSAYEVAVANGFEGTEAEWLDSLRAAEPEITASAATVPAGTPATATVTGTYPDLEIEMQIPQGTPGTPGASVGVLTTKGDILVRDSGAGTRLPVGADGRVLMADPTAATGVAWGVLPGSNLAHANVSTGGDLRGDTAGAFGYQADITRITSQAHQGTGCLRVTATGAYPSIRMGVTSLYAPGAVPVAPGEVVVVRTWVRADSVTRLLRHYMYWFAGGAAATPAVTYGSEFTVSTTWTQLVSVVAVPTGVDSLRLDVGGVGGMFVAGETFDIDTISYATAASAGGVILRGASSPEGVVVAPPGVQFVDDATGTTYIKRTGATATGWAQMYPLANTPRIIAVGEVSAVVGDTLQLFKRGMVESASPESERLALTSTKGATYRRFWEYTPAAGDVGVQTLTIALKDANYANAATASLTVRVKAAANPASMKRVMCLGDSLTEGMVWPQEAYRRLTQTGGTPAGHGFSNFEFIGNTPFPSFPSQGGFGQGGWTWASYTGETPVVAYTVTATGHGKTGADQKSIWSSGGSNWSLEQVVDANTLRFIRTSGTATLTSGTLTWVSGGVNKSAITFTGGTAAAGTPFWDGSAFSIKAWCDANGGSGPDLVITMLGWNTLSFPHSTTVAQAKVFADKLHTEYPSAKMVVFGPQVPSPFGGLGTNYGAADNVWGDYVRTLRAVHDLTAAYQAWSQEPAYSGWVRAASLLPLYDAENGYPAVQVPVNSRNTATETRQINGLHPVTEGRLQIADAAYREIVRALS